MGWTVDATQDYGMAQQGLLYLVASTAQFRTITSAANAAAALAYCHQEADDTDATESTRPRAILLGDSYQILDSQNHNDRSQGELLLSLEFPVTNTDKGRPEDELARFLNSAETVVSQMRALSGTGTGYFAGKTHFCIASIQHEEGPEVMTETVAAGTTERSLTFAAIIYRVTFNSVPG